MAKMTQKELEDWADYGIRAATVESELRRAVRAMTSLLSANEWAEHLSRDPDASDLEAAITSTLSRPNTEAQRAAVGGPTGAQS